MCPWGRGLGLCTSPTCFAAICAMRLGLFSQSGEHPSYNEGEVSGTEAKGASFHINRGICTVALTGCDGTRVRYIKLVGFKSVDRMLAATQA